MDASGDAQVDEDYTGMFVGSAGRPSWELQPSGKPIVQDTKVPGMRDEHASRQGRRLFHNTPTTQSIVDQVVFGRDMDQSGDTAFDNEFLGIYGDSAGRPSWKVPLSGKRIFDSESCP